MARPPKYDKRQEAKTITAPAVLWEIAKQEGGGNTSLGVRIALEKLLKKK